MTTFLSTKQLHAFWTIVFVLFIVALLLILGAGCASVPTIEQAAAATTAGATVGTAVRIAAPEIAPFVETLAAAVRSVNDESAPSPAAVKSTLSLWAAPLPISAAAKAAAVQVVAAKYTAAFPAIEKAGNALDAVEDFAAGLEKS